MHCVWPRSTWFVSVKSSERLQCTRGAFVPSQRAPSASKLSLSACESGRKPIHTFSHGHSVPKNAKKKHTSTPQQLEGKWWMKHESWASAGVCVSCNKEAPQSFFHGNKVSLSLGDGRATNTLSCFNMNIWRN